MELSFTEQYYTPKAMGKNMTIKPWDPQWRSYITGYVHGTSQHTIGIYWSFKGSGKGLPPVTLETDGKLLYCIWHHQPASPETYIRKTTGQYGPCTGQQLEILQTRRHQNTSPTEWQHFVDIEWYGGFHQLPSQRPKIHGFEYSNGLVFDDLGVYNPILANLHFLKNVSLIIFSFPIVLLSIYLEH